MEWNAIMNKEDGSVIIPDNWIFPYYYDALNSLFRIENALRVFTYVVLKNEFKDKWPDLNVTSDDNASTSIGKIAKQRLRQTQQFGYLGYIISCPLMYLTSGELIRVIFSDSYWRHFSSYFPGSKENINTKLDEINSVRNALAHFRPIKQDDLELLKQNAKLVLPKVENCLINIAQCDQTIPTNTSEIWYKELKTSITKDLKFTFKQSADEKWVKLEFLYNFPVLVHPKYNEIRMYKVLNLDTPAILHYFPELKSHMIFLSERILNFMIVDDLLKANKSIAMVFSRKTIAEEHEIIRSQILELITKILEETKLLQDDNLARGELVQKVDALARLNNYGNRNSGWAIDIRNLTCIAQENDPPEYWGQQMFMGGDFITSVDNYPWMPVRVSKSEISF